MSLKMMSLTMLNNYRIDWEKWNVKHVAVSNDVDIHETPTCLMPSCVNGCVGHASTLHSVQPGFTQHVYSGTQHHGALLQHVVDRAIATPKRPRVLRKYVNPYKDLRKSSRDGFRFKGMASRQFT